MLRPRVLIPVLAAVLLIAVAGPAAADTVGHPVLSVHLPADHVDAGATTSLNLFLLNGGYLETGGNPAYESRVTTARNVVVSVAAGDAPLTVKTGPEPVGTVPEGVIGPIAFAVTVDDNATPGTYQLPVTVTYEYTSKVDTSKPTEPKYTNETKTLNRTVAVTVDPVADFTVVGVTSDLTVGQTGPVTLAVRNDGSQAASDSTVAITSQDPSLSFTGGPTAAEYVGNWAAGQVRNVTLSATVVPGADVRSYPLSVSVGYTDADRNPQQSTPVSAGVVPHVEQTFAVSDVSSTLAVGDQGTITGTVTNTGPTAVRNAVVVLSADVANLVPVETEYAVGDLAPNASATFSFDAEVSDTADAGPRQLSLAVRYRDAANDVQQSDPLDARVTVGPKQPAFSVKPVQGSVAVGDSGVLKLRVTNAGDQPVTDVSAKLFVNDPLSSSDDEAFVSRLAPGASTTLTFDVSASTSALQKAYPASIDFQYTDHKGDTRLSDTYDVPVTVTASQNSGGPSTTVLGGAAALIVVLVLVGLWYWRRS